MVEEEPYKTRRRSAKATLSQFEHITNGEETCDYNVVGKEPGEQNERSSGWYEVRCATPIRCFQVAKDATV